MPEVELELTYLAKYLPEGLFDAPSKVIVDNLYPLKGSEHPRLRIRRSGDKYEITKKLPVNEGDASHQHEHTIKLTKLEYDDLTKTPGRQVTKRRYYYPYNGMTAEIDVFAGALEGLVLVDFEFDDRQRQLDFAMPDFCLADVTQETAIAGGMLAGKRLADIMPALQRYEYKALN